MSIKVLLEKEKAKRKAQKPEQKSEPQIVDSTVKASHNHHSLSGTKENQIPNNRRKTKKQRGGGEKRKRTCSDTSTLLKV